MIIETEHLIATLKTKNDVDYCLFEYKPNSFVTYDVSVEMTDVRKLFESIGVRRFVGVVNKGVRITKEANAHFSKPEELKNIHYIAVCPKGVPGILIRLLDFFFKFKKHPLTRYFKDVEKGIDWVIKQ